MPITRFPGTVPGRCEAVVSDGLVYAVVNAPQPGGTIEAQTAGALAELERVLSAAGSGRAGLLQVTVYLADIHLKPRMDTVWTPWIGAAAHWPQQACLGVGLDDGYLIEIVATAKVLDG
ncbi:MAG: Rid family hydrolase [Pseudomonadota bacterium]